MKKTALGLILVVLVTSHSFGQSVADKLQDASFTVRAGAMSGSGFMVTRDKTHYVWTAAHVIKHLKGKKEVTDEKGVKKTIVTFPPILINKELYENYVSVGKTELEAEVIRYSNDDTGLDLALLRVKKKGFTTATTKFDIDAPPALITPLICVGSPHGQKGSNTVTVGTLSQWGRVDDGQVFDQASISINHGSSGGLISRAENGLVVGMIQRMASETFAVYRPTREIRKWCIEMGVEFVINESLPVPDEKVLMGRNIEDSR